MRLKTRAILISMAAAGTLLHSATSAAWSLPTDSFWAPLYGQAAGASVTFANGAVLRNLTMTPVSPPAQNWGAGGFSTSSFFDVFFDIAPSGGSFGTDHLQGPVQVDVGPATPDLSLPDTQDYSTQVTGLNLTGTSSQVELRLSLPEPPIITFSTVTHVGPSGYSFGSFFDVWAELSMDGGNTWSAGATPLSVQGLPEPETYAMLLAGLGLLALAARRRRQAAV